MSLSHQTPLQFEQNVKETKMLGLGLGFAAEEEHTDKMEKKKKKQTRRYSRPGNRRRARDDSPDSVILFSSDQHSNNNSTILSRATLLSSTSASIVDRCSFGSDRDAVCSHFSNLHLAGRERSSGLDPDPEEAANLIPNNVSSKLEDFIEPEEDIDQAQEEKEGDEKALDPSNQSFSHALRECQNRRLRSEAHTLPDRKHQRPRPASLDLNGQAADAVVLSPRFFVEVGGIRKSSAASSRSRTGTFPSPGTPNYRHGGGMAGYQKGWSSERVPLPANCSRRYGASGALYPFNNGRTLPSKWEDAERWIFSPAFGDGAGRTSVLPSHLRRPKSKSGPLGAPMRFSGSYSSASPLVPCFERGRVGNFAGSSPFMTGILMADRGCCGNASSGNGGGGGGGGGEVRSCSADGEPYIVRSTSVPGWSDMIIEPSSLPSSQGTEQDEIQYADEKLNRITSTRNSPVGLRRDMATQMSPEGSTHSSPKKRHLLSSSPPLAHPVTEMESPFSKLEVRDVQVDDRVTVTRLSKKNIVQSSDKGSSNIIEWKKKTVEARDSALEVAETEKSISKYKREEAKIIAWENLQKAKAEAALRKLEMKLEKKRTSSMGKIINKLRSAQKKAQEMRSAVIANQAHQVPRTTRRSSHFPKAGQMSSLSGCFTCHAF